MDDKEVTVYVASSVGIDYFYFLLKTIREAGFSAKSISFISEIDYRQEAKASGIVKMWLRTKMYIFYPLYLVVSGLTCKSSSIFVVSSNTFYAPYIVHALLRFRGIRVVHMLYDLYPDALEIAGGLKPTSMLSKFIGMVAKANQTNCDGTVYLGNILRKHAESRWGRCMQSEVIDISTDLSLYDNTYCPLPQSGPIIIHYGGQLGHLHDAESIITCVRMIYESDLSRDIRFTFYTSGAQARFLKDSLANYPVNIISTAPSSQWRSDIRGFNIGLVSLSPGGATVCLPSKTYAMMAGGLAILAITPLWSDLASLVMTLDAGWIINNSAHKSFPNIHDRSYLETIKEVRPQNEIAKDFKHTVAFILRNRDLLEKKRSNAFNGVRDCYDVSKLSAKWRHLLTSLTHKTDKRAYS